MVETLLTTILFLTAIVFAMVQFSLISFGWFRANDAAQAGVRCAVVAKGTFANNGPAKNAARFGVFYVLGARFPSITDVDAKPLGNTRDHSNRQVTAFSVHAYYIQRIMFASILQPFLGRRSNSLYGGGFKLLNVSHKHGMTGATYCSMVKPPDYAINGDDNFYMRAYPGARRFDE